MKQFIRIVCALALAGFALTSSGADPGFAARAPFDPAAFSGGAVSAIDPTTDAAPGATVFGGANAYPQATVNTTGGNVNVCPGIGRRLFTIVDFSLIDAIDTVTVTVNGSATVKTAGGTDWTAATSNAATATSLATAINTITGVVATTSGSSVYLAPTATTCTLTLATSMDAGEGTATSGTDGTLTVTGATPQDATYWTSSANATLTAETNLGALTTGLVLNTVGGAVGTPSAYGGTSCTNQFPRSLNASGAATCASVANDDLSGSIAASKLVGTDIATVGTITSGVWNAGAVTSSGGGSFTTGAFSSTGASTAVVDITVSGDNVNDRFGLTFNSGGENGTILKWMNAFGDLTSITGTKVGSGASGDDGKIVFAVATNSVLSTVFTLSPTGASATGTLGVTGTLTIGSTIDRIAAGALTIGGTATSLVVPNATITSAASGVRYLCISTTGVITSQATACVGT